MDGLAAGVSIGIPFQPKLWKSYMKSSDEKRHYRVLDENHNVVPATMFEWAMFFEERTVAKSDVAQYRISTVFLGLDHSHGVGPPLYFETMVFDTAYGSDSWREVDVERYETWEQARCGHLRFVEKFEKMTGLKERTELDEILNAQKIYRELHE